MRCYHKFPAWVSKAYHAHTVCRQTFDNLSETYKKDPQTIRKYFDNYSPVKGEIISCLKPVNIVMDATFFKRGSGLFVARANGKNLYWFQIETEKVEHYEQCLNTLTSAGLVFSSFTIDGRRGVRLMLQAKFPSIPIQQCQFHQIQTIIHKITKHPKLEAGKELLAITLTLSKTTRREFEVGLQAWLAKWHGFIGERTESHDLKRKWRWTHENLRSAYFSLKRNLAWLFTYQEYPDLNIPNTTNSCDGSFSHWKNKVGLHRGIRKDRKKKMIDYLLEN